MLIRNANASDFTQILQLNEESVHFLSPLSLLRLQSLHAEADYHRVLEIDNEIVGFLLAFREGSQYDSTNYLWFLNQYEKFLYIDRVVIGKQHQGRGIGNKLYDDIFVYGRSSNAIRITCEFDIDPPNEASRRFHQHYGFEEVGTRSYGNVSKQVSLQAVAL